VGLGVLASDRPCGFLCANVSNNSEQGCIVDFWQVLPVAIALVFIIEGLIPFMSPNRWRNMLAIAGEMDDRVIRNIGLGSMLLGLALLYWVN
jgi:uncharacterized protein